MDRASTNWAISAENLQKAYYRGRQAFPVLRGVSLNVAAGECVFLVGPSGSGKSTLLSLLGCILAPDEGHLSILGHNVCSLSEAGRVELRRRHLGFLFQRFHLLRGLSALENVMVPLQLKGAATRFSRKRAAELLDLVGLGEQRDADPRQMSVGQCQRIALARALAGDPELILADEPTAALDAARGHDAMELLYRLTRSLGKTVVVVTHDPRIEVFADRVLCLEDGRVSEQRHFAHA